MNFAIRRNKSRSSYKKWDIFIFDPKNINCGRMIRAGDRRYSDYTIHKDPERRDRYIDRHRANEDWTKSGLYTPGWWSRWLLWEKPGIEEAAENIEDRFGLVFRGILR